MCLNVDVPLKQYQLNFRINALTLTLSRWARESLAGDGVRYFSLLNSILQSTVGDGVLDVPLKQYQLNFRINALTLPSPVGRGYFLWDALIL